MMVNILELKSHVFQSATYDTILQVCLRILSFSLNSFIIRHISPAAFAVINVRLYLLYSTGLLLSREAFRRALLGCKSPKNIRKAVNLIWRGTLLAIPISFLGGIIWIYILEPPPPNVTLHYHWGVYFTMLSIIIEVSAESPYIMAELHMWTKSKVVIEGLMHLIRAVVLAIGVFMWPFTAVLLYGIGHVLGSIVYAFSYYWLFAIEFSKKERIKNLLIPSFGSLFFSGDKKTKLYPEVDEELWLVSYSFFKQGWIKEVLTVGELYMMSFFPLISLSDQGIYQVVNNLGSLAARLIFRGIENASYKFFAQNLHRGIKIKNQEQENIEEVSRFLSSLLKNVVVISLFIMTFGWAYSHSILYIYSGSDLSSSGYGLLRLNFIYVMFLGLNGVTEAFTFAAMSDRDISNHNIRLSKFSAVYILATVVSTYFFGAYGFIIGNSINMTLRIKYSLSFISDLFDGSDLEPLNSLFVSKKVFLSFFFAFGLTYASEIYVYFWSVLAHLVIGFACFVTVIFFLRFEMEEMILSFLSFVDKIYSRFFHQKAKPYNCFLSNVIYYILYKAY